MSDEIADQFINSRVADVDHVKNQTAEALEEAARNLRNTNVSSKGEDIKHILHRMESQVDQLKVHFGEDYRRIERDYHKDTKFIEQVIISHPVPSILIASGIGLLIGMAIHHAHK
jgi:ElaB/YqjD/DUF883 family membrane-anchored ribosome-binding protein